jgi:hypothetical protein
MTKFYETKEFKKLEQRWKSKLKKSGFDDAEQSNGMLKVWSSTRAQVEYKNPIALEAKQTYYRLAAQFLNNYSFKNKTEYNIWKLHCEGVSFTNIQKQLQCSHGAPQRVITRLKKAMKEYFLTNGSNNE